jgi:hypothetical protein
MSKIMNSTAMTETLALAFQKLTHAAEADSAHLQTLAQIALDQLQGHELRCKICVTLRTLSAIR